MDGEIEAVDTQFFGELDDVESQIETPETLLLTPEQREMMSSNVDDEMKLETERTQTRDHGGPEWVACQRRAWYNIERETKTKLLQEQLRHRANSLLGIFTRTPEQSAAWMHIHDTEWRLQQQ